MPSAVQMASILQAHIPAQPFPCTCHTHRGCGPSRTRHSGVRPCLRSQSLGNRHILASLVLGFSIYEVGAMNLHTLHWAFNTKTSPKSSHRQWGREPCEISSHIPGAPSLSRGKTFRKAKKPTEPPMGNPSEPATGLTPNLIHRTQCLGGSGLLNTTSNHALLSALWISESLPPR